MMTEPRAPAPVQRPAPPATEAGWSNTGLWIAGGLALGVAAAVLLPRERGESKGMSRTARTALGLASEVGLALAANALGHTDQPAEPASADAAGVKTSASTVHQSVAAAVAGRFPKLAGTAKLVAGLWHRRKSK